MHSHRYFSVVVVLLSAMVGLIGATGLAYASPSSHSGQSATAMPHTPQAVSLTNKVILDDTSIAGPAFNTETDTFEGVTTTRNLIAWTGTDGAHHLNIMSSTQRFPKPQQFGNKITLHETSPYRPAVTQLGTGGGGAVGYVAIAWTGSDPAHTLNVLWNAYGISGGPPQKKLTLWGETSISGPALVLLNGNKLLLAWTGTDANHSLNVLPLSVPTLTPGTKTVLPQFSGLAGPNLTPVTGVSGTTLVMSWTTPTLHLNLASSSDGVQFTNALGAAGLVQLSATAPDFVFAPSEGGPDYWLAWTGTDPMHFLNIQWTSHYPQWPDPATTKTVLSDRALGGPQIAFNAGYDIAWTGTDSAHHLNIAYFQGF
jgi:hypothetical protein